MHYKKDELTLLYNSRNPRDIKTLAYASTISTRINRQDINSVEVSATLFKMMVEKLGGDPKVLINKSSTYYQEHLRGTEYKPKMWLLAIKKMPDLLIAPIALYRDRAVICASPTDVLKVLKASVSA